MLLVKTDLPRCFPIIEKKKLYLLTILNETLFLRMIRKNVYTNEILMKTHLTALNGHCSNHLGTVLKT